MKVTTSVGAMDLSFKNDVLSINFEGTDAVLCVYAEKGGFKVAYMALPDCDRPLAMSKYDVRFDVHTTNVAEWVEEYNKIQEGIKNG